MMVFQIVNSGRISLSFPYGNIINANFLHIRIIDKLDPVIQALDGIIAGFNAEKSQYLTGSFITKEHRYTKDKAI